MLSCLQISEEKQFLVSLNPLLPYTHTFYATLDLYPLPEDSQFSQRPFTEILFNYFLRFYACYPLYSFWIPFCSGRTTAVDQPLN